MKHGDTGSVFHNQKEGDGAYFRTNLTTDIHTDIQIYTYVDAFVLTHLPIHNETSYVGTQHNR